MELSLTSHLTGDNLLYVEEMIDICNDLIKSFLLCVLQVISLESWVNIMYYVQDAHSFWDWIYFVALIVVSVSALCVL